MSKQYVILNDNRNSLRISEIFNDCNLKLCVPTYKNESLSSILQKICNHGGGDCCPETDPIFTGSVAFNITQTDINNWNSGGYTDEQAQDAIGGILQNSASILFSYNDSTPYITASVPSSFVKGLLSATAPITFNSSSGVISTLMATNSLIGRTTVGSGVMEEISIGAGLDLTSNVLSSTGAPASGSGNYIQNNFVGPQATANWWISGHGRVNDYLQVHNAARLVTDSTAKLAVTTSTDSTFGADLRVRVLRFWDFAAQNNAASSTSLIFSEQGNFLTLKADANIVLDAPIIAFNQPTYIAAGGFHSSFVIRGEQGSIGDNDFFGLWNANAAGNSKALQTKMTFNHQRTTGGRTMFARIGSEVIDFSNTLYKGDLVFETVDATVNSGQSTEKFRIKYDGRLYSTSLDTDNVAPTTTGTTKMVICDALGLISFTDIPSGGGGSGGTITSVALSSTDLSVSGSPLTGTGGTITANINNDAVTYAKIQNVSAASRLLGRGDSGSGDVQELTVGSGLQIVGTVLSATVGGGTPTFQQVLTSGSTLTGNNTVNASGFNFTMNNNGIITWGATNSQIIIDEPGHDLTLLATDKTFLKIANFGAASPGDVLSIVSAATGEVAWAAPGAGSGGSVTSFSAGDLSPLFTTSEATVTTTPALTFILTNAGAHTYFGNNTGSGAAPAYKSNAALTKVDDTNVTLTLGGAPATSLLEAASLTLGWTGQLSIARGGTGLGALGTALQQLRVNAGATALEYFTPATPLTSLNGLTAATQIFATGTAGADFNIVSSISTHTFNLPSASSVNRGAMDITNQTFAGAKTFELGLVINFTGANSDTRIAGDTESNLFFVKASNDRIGLFTNTPVAPLHISKGVSTFSGSLNPTVFIDSGAITACTMELKGSAFLSGLVVSNTGPSCSPYIQLYNEGNDKAWSHVLETDTSYSFKEGLAGIEGTVRMNFAPSNGTVSLLGNFTLLNKINKYNNTSILNGELLIGHTANGTFEKGTLTGTTNQVIFTNGAGSIIASLPQDYHTTATPQLLRLGLGGASSSAHILQIAGSASVLTGIRVFPSITPTVNGEGYGIYSDPSFVRAPSGTHAMLSACRLSGITVTGSGAAITRTAMLYIPNPSSATTTSGFNDSIYVASGTSRFDGDLVYTTTGTNYTTGGYDLLVKNLTTGKLETVVTDLVIFNAQVASYTLVLADRGQMVKINNASANILTVPPNASVAFPIGTTILVYQEGAGQITITAGAGVVLKSAGSLLKTRLLDSVATLIKSAANTWIVSGDLA